MLTYVLKRILRGILALWLAITITFVVLRLLPGRPTTLMLDGVNDPELEQQLLEEYGLDKPLIVQYFYFLGQLCRGNLGTSFYGGARVTDVLMTRLPWTLLLAGTAFVFTLALGIPLGVWASKNHGRWPDQFLKIFGLTGEAAFVPAVAVLLLAVFSLNLGLFPIGGAVDTSATGTGEKISSVLMHLVLPLVSLVFIQIGPYALTVRTNMNAILASDYVRSAVSRGLRQKTVVWRHALRNAIIPALTLAGVQLGTLVSGAVLTETVFAYPGIGRLIYESVLRQDFPVLQGAFILLAATVIIANLLTDCIVLLIDPKIKAATR